MNWSGRKVLVTGAGGFIGSHLAERLVEEGAETTAFVHYNALGSWGWLDHSRHVREMRVISGDITDRDMVRESMRGADAVFHLAALIAIPYSYQAPGSYVRTNVEGSLNVFQNARELSVARVIHTSTSEVYGTAQYVPIDERHPQRGQSPYSASKIGADKLAEAFHDSFGLPVTVVRPFNTFGPRQSARAVVPTIIGQCLTSDVVRLGSTTPTRDLNYVQNTVDGFLRAAASTEAIGTTIQFGSGREISIGDLAHTIARITGKPINVIEERNRVRPENSEVRQLIADNSLAKRLLGWSPLVSLEAGLEATVDWMRQNLNRYRTEQYVV